MKRSELLAHQEAIETFKGQVEVTFGKVTASAQVQDLRNISIKFYLSTEKGVAFMDGYNVHSLTPEELRWMASVSEHFERWMADNENWPLPLPEYTEHPELNEMKEKIAAMSTDALLRAWDELEGHSQPNEEYAPGLTMED